MAGINSLGGINNYSRLFGNTDNKKKDSISQLWSSYSNFQSNVTSSLAGLTEVNANLKAVLSSYDDTEAEFRSRMTETLDDLSKSAAKIKDYNFSVKTEGAVTTTTETDKDGNVTKTTTYSKELQAAVDTVKEFVSNYNDTIKFFGDHRDVSKRIDQMANTFGDTTYRASLYDSIGLTTNSDGSQSINEAKLVKTILNAPNKISSVLGKGGLAGKTESHISFANSQADKLFPTVDEMFGDQLKTASIYTGKAYRNMTAYSNLGNLINQML